MRFARSTTLIGDTEIRGDSGAIRVPEGRCPRSSPQLSMDSVKKSAPRELTPTEAVGECCADPAPRFQRRRSERCCHPSQLLQSCCHPEYARRRQNHCPRIQHGDQPRRLGRLKTPLWLHQGCHLRPLLMHPFQVRCRHSRQQFAR